MLLLLLFCLFLESSSGVELRSNESCRYLALPRVVRQEEDMAYTLDNLVISATLPDKIDFHLESYASLDTTALAAPDKSSLQTEIYLTATVRGITARAPNVRFFFRVTNVRIDCVHLSRNVALGVRNYDRHHS